MKKMIALLLVPCIYYGYLSGNNALSEFHEIIPSEYCGPSINTDTSRLTPLKIIPFQLEIVPPSSGVQFFRNGIIFLSYSKNAEKMLPKHLSFGAAGTYYAHVRDSVPGELRPFAPELSFSFPVDAATFSSDYNTIYFTHIPDGGDKEQIFRAEYSVDKWIADNDPLSFCTENNIFTHPALSADGSFMVFSSDQPGTLGGLDLFISRKDEDIWEKPENLGEQINSIGNELYAALDNENNLYFSSDGLPGEGGYDIYICRYNGSSWSSPRSIAQEVNSKHDEVSFKLSLLDEKTAFYTSRERSGRVRAQLLKVTLAIGPIDSITLSRHFLDMAGFEDETEDLRPEVQTVIASNNTVIDMPQTEVVEPVKETIIAAEVILEKPSEVKTEAIIQPAAIPPSENELIYRVQILANVKPVGSYNVTIAGKSYKTFEYYYKGGYRTTVGEFSTLTDATKFQNVCRQSGYNQAFIAAFSNDVRITESEARNMESKSSAHVSVETKEMLKSETEIEAPSISAVQNHVNHDTLTKKEELIYRVQILANSKPVGSYMLTIGNNTYQTFEYLYMGGYRTTVGQFVSIEEAAKFQNLLRQSGYKNAFVVAFKNGVRSTDPSLFK